MDIKVWKAPQHNGQTALIYVDWEQSIDSQHYMMALVNSGGFVVERQKDIIVRVQKLVPDAEVPKDAIPLS